MSSEEVHSVDTPGAASPVRQLTAAEAVAGIDWQERLRVAVEQALTRRTAQRAERETKQRRRNYGLERRHARKLAHVASRRREATDDAVSNESPTLPKPQVRESSPVGQTGTESPPATLPTTDSTGEPQ